MTCRPAAAFLFLLVLLFPASSSADECDLTLAETREFRSTVRDLDLHVDRLWAAETYRVTSYSTTGGELVPAGTRAVAGMTGVVDAVEGGAWVGSSSTLFFFDLDMNVIHSVFLDAEINDILQQGEYLYVATTGRSVLQLIAAQPGLLPRLMETSTGSASSVAFRNGTLYAADGDSTIEAFSLTIPSLPQKIGSIPSFPQTNRIHFDGDRLIASNGRQTEIFSGSGAQMNRIGVLEEGSSSWVRLNPGVAVSSGLDTTLRAFDVSSASRPVKTWETRLPASGGSLNRIGSLAADSWYLYVAAGDLGIVRVDVESFHAPYLLRTVPAAGPSSIALGSDEVYVGFPGAGVQAWELSSTGSLVVQRTVVTGSPVIRDYRDGSLLLSAGGEAFVIDAKTGEKTASVTIGFGATDAELADSGAWILGSDGTVSRASFESGAVSPVDLAGIPISWIDARDGVLAAAGLNEAGSTVVFLVRDGEQPASMTIDGAATSGVAVDGSGRVALVTFRGLSVVDVAAGTEIVTPRGRGFATSLVWLGDEIVISDGSGYEIRGPGGEVRRTIEVSGGGRSLSASESGAFAGAISNQAVTIISGSVSAGSPGEVIVDRSNLFYDRLATGEGFILLGEPEAVERINFIGQRLAPSGRAHASAGDAVELTPYRDGWCELLSDGTIACRGASGATFMERKLDEGADSSFLGIRRIGGLFWVTVSKGCLSTGCVTVSVLLDDQLMKVGEIGGGIRDSVVSGGRGWILTSAPRSVLALDISNPSGPVVAASMPVESSATAIAHHESGTLYVLSSEGAIAMNDTSLLQVGAVPLPTAGGSLSAQTFAISGECAFVIGRTGRLEVFRIDSPLDWGSYSSTEFPASPVDLVVEGEPIFVLTTHSVEVLFSGEPPPPVRRPGARRR